MSSITPATRSNVTVTSLFASLVAFKISSKGPRKISASTVDFAPVPIMSSFSKKSALPRSNSYVIT